MTLRTNKKFWTKNSLIRDCKSDLAIQNFDSAQYRKSIKKLLIDLIIYRFSPVVLFISHSLVLFISHSLLFAIRSYLLKTQKNAAAAHRKKCARIFFFIVHGLRSSVRIFSVPAAQALPSAGSAAAAETSAAARKAAGRTSAWKTAERRRRWKTAPEWRAIYPAWRITSAVTSA